VKFIIVDQYSHVPANTLGIEITTPAIAARCDRGNIDPQHGQMSEPFPGALTTSPVLDATAAIDAALDWPLPKEGFGQIATERPDLDSIGAMAVLALRRDRVELSSEAIYRIEAIAAADNFGKGKWAPAPLPTEAAPWPRGAACVADTSSLAHIASICSPQGEQPHYPIEFRVACVATWILGGDNPTYEQSEAAIGATLHQHLQPGYWPVGPGEAEDMGIILKVLLVARADVNARRADMARALEDGRISLHEEHGIAVVRGSHSGALGIGYCIAPCVVATNPEHRWPQGHVTSKTTIAFYEPPGVERMTKIRDALNAREPQGGWGGNLKSGIIGSPQGRASALSEAEILACVQGAL
jgi:hypothetical protein